ncbi:hypothetical protein BVRB_2g029850 [Beta vulgaris subsp. vulgaris]|nr:hypothetical protein BVRB_2g029850 [Beta vulgaris subsp. vulgaris]
MIADAIEDEEKWLFAGIVDLQQNGFHTHHALAIPLSFLFNFAIEFQKP